ncbi:MAG: hypothetical protein WCY07_12795, partial [Pigmentiphaga sp.]
HTNHHHLGNPWKKVNLRKANYYNANPLASQEQQTINRLFVHVGAPRFASWLYSSKGSFCELPPHFNN